MIKLFKVIISRKARKGLNEITDYYEQTASSSTAKKVRKGLLKTTRSLERFPQSKPILPDTENQKQTYRYAKKWSFKIIFTIFKKKDQVRVLSYRHDKEDPKKLKDL